MFVALKITDEKDSGTFVVWMFTAVGNCISYNELLNFAYTLPHDITTMPLTIRQMSISDTQNIGLYKTLSI